MKQKLLLGSLVVVLITASFLIFIPRKSLLDSASPSSVKDTLDNSQLSFFSRIGVGPSIGDSIITIRLDSGTVPSITTNNLFVGDTIAIGTTGAGVGTTGGLTTYVIKDVGNTGTIELATGIGQSNAFINAALIATRSAKHVISWTPQSSLTGGFWQFLIRVSNRSGEAYNDGIPDQQGFDVGGSNPASTSSVVGARLQTTDVICPSFGVGATGAYASSVGTTVAISDGSPAATHYYNIFTCSLGAGITNQVNVGYTMAIGLGSTNAELINPSDALSHSEGSADVYTFYIRHLDNGSNIISSDTIQGKIAVVESVRVTATVDPSITFQIGTSGLGTGTSACNVLGSSQQASVTADAVPFGSLTLSAFNDLAQWISCVTNATSGYSVTVYETKAMTNINDAVTIPDTTCDGSGQTCGVGTTAAWYTRNSASQFGFGMQKINANFTPINTSVGTTFYASPFGKGASNATVVMRNTSTPTVSEAAWMCYRLTASSTQEAGNYEDEIVYTATATF